jgi:hypothetical protein
LVSDEREIFAVSVVEFQFRFGIFGVDYVSLAVFLANDFNFVFDRIACWQAFADSIKDMKIVEIIKNQIIEVNVAPVPMKITYFHRGVADQKEGDTAAVFVN